MIGQLALFWRLTYYELSWDVVEPMAYLYGIAVEMAVLSYFLVSRKDLSYEGVHSWVSSRHVARAAARSNLDLIAFDKLLADREVLRRRLELSKEIRELGEGEQGATKELGSS